MGDSMATEPLSESVQLITLPAEPHLSNEMDLAAHEANAGSACDVVVDFSLVEILPSATICSLIVLERLLTAMDRRLVLCSVPPNILGIFRRVGLHSLFRLADDRSAALKRLSEPECPS